MHRPSFAPFLGLLFLMTARPATSQVQQASARSMVVPFEPASNSAEAKLEFKKAHTDWQNANAAGAVRHLERTLLLDPDFGFARIVRGGVKPGLSGAERQQEYDRGLAALGRASAGEILLGLAWREQFGGRTRNSAPLFEAALQLYPGDPDVARWASVARRAGRAPTDVIAEIRRLIQAYPDYPPNHFALGYALYNSGDRAGGVAAMQEYARVLPDHPNPPESVAELMLREGRNAEAVQAAQRAVQLDSTFTASYAVLADIKLNAGDVAGARADWTKALRLAPSAWDSTDMVHTTALSYLTQNDSKAAMARLGDAAAMAEGKNFAGRAALIHEHMAAIDGLYGDGRGVAGHLAKAAELAPNSGGLFLYSALAYAGAGKLDQARTAAESFSSIATDANRNTRNLLNGFIAIEANDFATAAKELEQANQNISLTKELLAEARAKQGQAAAAQALRDQVRKSATLISGGWVLDFTVLMAKQRAKTLGGGV